MCMHITSYPPPLEKASLSLVVQISTRNCPHLGGGGILCDKPSKISITLMNILSQKATSHTMQNK